MMKAESTTSISLRFTSLLLTAIPVFGFAFLFTFFASKIPATSLVPGLLVVVTMPFVYGLLLGLIGLSLKSGLSPVFAILKNHWLNHASPSPYNSGAYSEVFHDDLKKRYKDFDTNMMIGRWWRLMVKCLIVSAVVQAAAWIVLIFSYAVSDVAILNSTLQLVAGPVTWLNPVSVFTEYFVTTEGAAFVLNSTLLLTAYYAALFFENVSRVVEYRLWSSGGFNKAIRAISDNSTGE